MKAFQVVADFEQALSEYTGAPYVVTVDSCTNALFLALRFAQRSGPGYGVDLPRRTYVGVACAVRNAGYVIRWRDLDWQGVYWLEPLGICDAAKRFTSGMYGGGMVCVSFQAYKHLPIGRGGAILTDSLEAATWLRRARFDGRDPDHEDTGVIGYHCYMTPPDAARGLWLMHGLAKDNPDLRNDHVDISGYQAFR